MGAEVAEDMLAPIWPCALLPQHSAEPLKNSPHVNCEPQLRLVRGSATRIDSGVPELAGVPATPWPSCPWLLSPQQYVRPSLTRLPQPCSSPTHTALKVKPAATGVGTATLVAATTPFARTPEVVSPQPYSAPAPLSARVKPLPANTRASPSPAVPRAGCGRVPPPPLPHAPQAHSPAHTMRPASVSAQSCVKPMDTADHMSPGAKATAAEAKLAVLSTGRREVLVKVRPVLGRVSVFQQYMALPPSMPHVDAAPAAMATQWLLLGDCGTACGGHVTATMSGVIQGVAAPRPMRADCCPQHSQEPVGPPYWPQENWLEAEAVRSPAPKATPVVFQHMGRGPLL